MVFGRAVRVGVVRDLVLDHRAVQVVDAEVQRELGHRQPVHHPEALDVRDVVEQQPGHREGLQRLGRRGHRGARLQPVADLAVRRVDEVVLVAQRDEDREAAGLVLQLAQPQHVVDPVPRLLDVAVQHRRRGLAGPCCAPAGGCATSPPSGCVVDDVLADLPVEDLRAAAGQRLQAGVDQLVEDLVGAAGREIFSNQWISVAVKHLSETSGSAAFSSRSTRG